MKLLWLTDLHLVARGETVHGVNPAARFSSALAAGLSAHRDIARIVITGDIVHAGRAAGYRVLEDALAACPIPVRLVPGNHDSPACLSALYARTGYSAANGYAEQVDGWNLVYLNSVQVEPSASGLTHSQIGWLAEKFAAAGDRPSLVFLHHPPFPTGIPALDDERFDNADALRDTLLGAAGRAHLFCGHGHRNVAGQWCGIPVTALAGTHLGFALELDRPSLKRRASAPGYAVILAEADSTVIHFDHAAAG